MTNRLETAVRMSDVLLGSAQMDRVFNLRTSAGQGTCFAHWNENGHFFLTAAHLMLGVCVGERVYFSHQSGWLEFEVSRIIVADDGSDLAAFATNLKTGGARPANLERCGVFPGQPLKFLGFPHGLESNYPNSNGYNSALVRTAFFSGVTVIRGATVTILDGFNNPGYSGGPVYGCGEDGLAKLFGVVSGYHFERQKLGQVFKRSEAGEEPVADHYVKLNSGMIYVTGIESVERLTSRMDVFQPE